MIAHMKSVALTLAISLPLSVISAPANAQSHGVEDEFPIPEGFASDITDIDGVDLYHVKGGEGPLALLVHGYGQTWYEWRHLMPELAETHTVVAVDLPSLGLSGPTESYAGQDVSELLHDFAKTFSPDAPFDLIAHDIGIWNTYPMVVENQSDIRRLVYMEAPIPDDGLYTWPAFTPQGASLAWHFSFFTLAEPLPEDMLTGNEREFLEDFILTRASNKDAFPAEVLDLYAASWAKPDSLSGSLEYYRALNETAKRNVPLSESKLSMPVLAIGGGNSMGAYQGEQLNAYANDVQAEVLGGCGHWLPEECAPELNALVVDFLTAE